MDSSKLEARFKEIVKAGTPRSKWLTALISCVAEADEAMMMTLLRVGHVLSWGSQHHAMRHIATPPSSATTLGLALYCLLLEEAAVQQRCRSLLPSESLRIVEWVQAHEQEQAGTASSADTNC